jgi:hypothetical protein
MSRRQISNIQQQFPELDLTQSVFGDVLKTYSNNKELALEALQQMKEELEMEKEQKIRELQEQFSTVTRDVIFQVLEGCKWDVDEAIVPLFTKAHEINQQLEEDDRKKREEERSKRPRPAEEEKKEEVTRKEDPFQGVDAKNITADKTKSVKIVAKTEIADTGVQISVEWEFLAGTSTSYDWIGMFKVGQPNNSYFTYEWRGKQEQKGSVTFVAPSTFGQYEFRYIPYGSYEHAGISNPIQVGPHVEFTAAHDPDTKRLHVKWHQKSGNSYPRAWVGLYRKSETNNRNYIAFEYAIPPYTEASFDAPIKPDEYEFRFFPYGYIDVVRSNTIKIEGSDQVIAVMNEDNSRIIAKLSILTVDPYYDSVWIGLYQKGETNNKKLKRYKWTRERFSEISFRAPTPGDYEFRLFAHKSYSAIASSNTLSVVAPPPKQ